VTIFRAYDVRGIYGAEFSESTFENIGKAFGSCYEDGTIALGRDTRISGPSLQAAFLKGILSTGCNADNYGVIPIPLLGFMTLADNYNAAAYISASHNPPEYNGIRFRTSMGYGMLYHKTDIMKYYNRSEFRKGTGLEKTCNANEAISRYKSYVSKKINITDELKIVLDMGNGSACIMDSFYQELNCNPFVINGSQNGMFPGRGSAPTEKSLQEASKYVISKNADYGVGFDADADRGLVIDDLGRIVTPEKVAIIISQRRYKSGDKVIAGLDCSMILEKELEPFGIKVERERVGDVFIANRVKDCGAVLGVERSTHFFLPEFQYSDDPFAMSLVLGEIISQGEKLSVLADGIPDYPYKQISIRLNEDPAGVMLRLKEALSAMQPNTMDGLKVTTDSYSVLIRPSNTEPIIRLYIETAAGDMSELEERYVGIIHRAIKA
jgi:phosphomannomutase / phosphoglucomutase